MFVYSICWNLRLIPIFKGRGDRSLQVIYNFCVNSCICLFNEFGTPVLSIHICKEEMNWHPTPNWRIKINSQSALLIIRPTHEGSRQTGLSSEKMRLRANKISSILSILYLICLRSLVTKPASYPLKKKHDWDRTTQRSVHNTSEASVVHMKLDPNF